MAETLLTLWLGICCAGIFKDFLNSEGWYFADINLFLILEGVIVYNVFYIFLTLKIGSFGELNCFIMSFIIALLVGTIIILYQGGK